VIRGNNEETINVQLGARGYTMADVKRIRALALSDFVAAPKSSAKLTITPLKLALKFNPVGLFVAYSHGHVCRIHSLQLPDGVLTDSPEQSARFIVRANPYYLTDQHTAQISRLVAVLGRGSPA